MTKVLLKPPGATEPIEVAIQRTRAGDRDSFSVAAGHYHADVEMETTAPGSGWLRVGGNVIPFRATRKGSVLQVWIRGRIHSFELVERVARRAAGRAAMTRLADLAAPMPGTILKINVRPGDAFEAHAALVVMESMKMEMTLSAPHAGRVKDITCRPGQLVEMGAVLIKFHEDSDAGLA
jgi:3-methylcrotonyl-CoA carboxylase alpha subunit